MAAPSCLAFPAVAEEERAPVEFGATYVTDVLSVLDGGIRRGTAWLGRGDVTASVDGRVFGIDGAEFFVDVMGVNPPDFSGRHVGDAQTVSNVEANSAIRPYEVWLSVPIGKGFTVKAGLVDLNSEFDVQDVGALFLNSSFGIGPDFSQTGVNGPSIFPAPATAALLRYEDDDWGVRLGVFDAVAGSLSNPRRTVFRIPGERGALLIGEVERKFPGDGEVQLGLWHYTTTFHAIDPGATGKATSQGGYALVQGTLARLGTSTLLGWARVGAASERTNAIGLYLGGGASWRTETCEIGLAVAHARLGAPGRRAIVATDGSADRAETAIELAYSRPVTPWLTVQPDIQYVINPSWDPSRENALVAGVRLSFSFSAD